MSRPTQHATRNTQHVLRTLLLASSLLLLFLPALQPLLSPSLTCGYDNVFHLWRAVQVEHLLRQGILFSRWAPDMAHGFGFPLFVFVSPASAYVAALLHLAGLPWPVALNTTFALGMVLGGLFAFLLGRELFGPSAGLVGAVAYVYAPYQAYEVFNRGSLWEAFAWAFPPLVVWGLHRWTMHRDRRGFVVGGLALAALILTHQLFAFLFAPLLVGWVLLAWYRTRDPRALLRGAAMGLLGLGLSGFYWLPGLAERGYVQTGRLLGTWVFDYHNNFITLTDLLAPPRSVDPALINDWPPKSLGLVPVLVGLLALLRWRGMDRAQRVQVVFLLILTVGFALMTLPLSLPLWEHLPLLPYVQFPWRFLGPAVLSLSLLAAAIFDPKRNTQYVPRTTYCVLRIVFFFVVVALILSSLGWFYPAHCPPPGEISVAGMLDWERATDTLGTTAKGEYLPVWVRRMPESDHLRAAYEAGGPIPRLDPESLPDGARVLQADYGPVDATVVLETPVPFRARYLAFYYPGWRVWVDGESVEVAPTDPEGLIVFDVPPGRHTVTVRFTETPLRLAADALSLLSLLLLVVLAVRGPRSPHSPVPASHRPRVSPPPRPCLLLCGIALLSLFLTVAIALDISPALRGPDEWRWAYALPGHPIRHIIPVSVLTAYLAFVFVAWKRLEEGTRRRNILGFLIGVALFVPLIQAGLIVAESPDILRPLFYRTVSAGASGVFSVGSTINSIADFLRRYPDLMPSFPVHPQRYPPGLPLLFHLARRALEHLPALADAIGFHLRRYQCHDLTLMRLPNATIATAVIQMALPIVGGTIVFPLYDLTRRVGGRKAAFWAAALYPMVPSFALWSARWDTFYPLLTCTAWYFFHRGLAESRRGFLAMSGLLLATTSFLNFGPLATLLPMGLFALLWAWEELQKASTLHLRRFLRSILTDGLIFALFLALPWFLYQLAFGTGFLDIWRVSMSFHLGLARDYRTWLYYHLHDFLLFLGVPLALLLVRAFPRALDGLRRGRLAPFPLSFGLGLLLLDLSGVARGEVARVWLFLTPFAVVTAAPELVHIARNRRDFAFVAVPLAIQLLVFNAFLRVVTTGLTDPPHREHLFSPPPISHPIEARLGRTVALLGFDVEPETARPGETIHLTLYWQALAPMERLYTVFTHLIGPEGGLHGQHDGMPAAGTAPTTCWLPGEIIVDAHEIPVASDAPSGEYILEAGLYLLETGERLPTSGPDAAPDGRIVLTSIHVEGK